MLVGDVREQLFVIGYGGIPGYTPPPWLECSFGQRPLMHPSMRWSSQDEGGLRPTGSANTLSALAETTKSIGIRRDAAVSPGGITDSSDDATIQQRATGESGSKSICAAVTALQDCLVCARRAVLAVTGAALRVRNIFCIDSTLLALVCCCVSEMVRENGQLSRLHTWVSATALAFVLAPRLSRSSHGAALPLMFCSTNTFSS